jgi:hypothetical protein
MQIITFTLATLQQLDAIDRKFVHTLMDFATPQDFAANPWFMEYAQSIDYQRDLR